MEAVSREIVGKAIERLSVRGITKLELEFQVLDLVPDSVTANRLILCIPEAFGSVLASRLAKVVMQTTFSVQNRAGKWETFPHSLEPVFGFAFEYAHEIFNNEPQSVFMHIARRSSIMNALNDMVEKGWKMDGVIFTPVALVGIPAEFYYKPPTSIWRRLFK